MHDEISVAGETLHVGQRVKFARGNFPGTNSTMYDDYMVSSVGPDAAEFLELPVTDDSARVSYWRDEVARRLRDGAIEPVTAEDGTPEWGYP